MKVFIQLGLEPFLIDRPAVDSRGFHISSVLKVCPVCEEIWARIRIDSSINPMVVGQLCARHPKRQHSNVIPGSLLEEPQTNCQTLDRDLLLYLPRELLIREFELTYKAIYNEPTDFASAPGIQDYISPDASYSRRVTIINPCPSTGDAILIGGGECSS